MPDMVKNEFVEEMSFSLNDATTIKISGERYIHSYLNHQFYFTNSSSTNFIFRAHQFSSFIVLLGTISSSTTFDPLHAFIVQNKDEMKIPLEMEFIPSIQEFRRAISSLSPEQQEFAEAIRELQMSNTMFGVVIIQIKPQLERVLNLPPESLTKEISLNEKLLKLFIEFQIPSDLLAYDEKLDVFDVNVNGIVNVDVNLTSTSVNSDLLSLRSVEKVRENVEAIEVFYFMILFYIYFINYQL